MKLQELETLAYSEIVYTTRILNNVVEDEFSPGSVLHRHF